MTRLLGAHVSVAGGLDNAFARGLESHCTALQIFTKNANRWQGKPISNDDAIAFQQAWQKSGIGPVIAHDAYLINLASPKQDVWEKSKSALRDELLRCAQLGITGLVMHPGAHLGTGVETGVERIREAFREILPETPPDVRLLLENTAGQGTYLGGDFAHLAALLEGFDEDRFGVCFDTCHAHTAGYDLSTSESYTEVMAEFDRLVGLEQIKAFHLNDCLKPCGSKVDRHTHIGQGTIGRTGFACLMQDQRLAAIPMLLETPKGDDGEMDRVNLALLRELAGESL
ncbi:deoxyribonuclease IV [Deltaproteobacteria bacterium IMCC39524]|nr:deoxyribonuclease IV [Deltaproteobacteria bacterium IMCC39524]